MGLEVQAGANDISDSDIRTHTLTPLSVVGVFLWIEYFRDRDREEFVLLLLSTANVIEGMSQISVGGLAASIVEPRQVFKVAILANAAAVILSHNHPSGAPRGAYVEC